MTRPYNPAPVCEKCGTAFKLADWGPRDHHYVIFNEKDGKLELTCPCCANKFDMLPADYTDPNEKPPLEAYLGLEGQ